MRMLAHTSMCISMHTCVCVCVYILPSQCMYRMLAIQSFIPNLFMPFALSGSFYGSDEHTTPKGMQPTILRQSVVQCRVHAALPRTMLHNLDDRWPYVALPYFSLYCPTRTLRGKGFWADLITSTVETTTW